MNQTQTYNHTHLLTRCLWASLLTLVFSGCASSNNATDDGSTDTTPPNESETSGDTAATDTESSSGSASDADADSDADTNSAAQDSDSDTALDTETDTRNDATDTDTSASGEVIWAYTFDTDMEGFYKDDRWEYATWRHNPDEGTLDLVFDYEDARDMTHLEQLLHKLSEEDWTMVGEDWREAGEIVYTIRVNQAEAVSVQPFIQTGNWEWCAQWYELVNDGAFHEYSLQVGLLDGTEGPEGDLIDISDVKSIGIEVNAGPPVDILAPMPAIEPGTLSLSIDSIVVKK